MNGLSVFVKAPRNVITKMYFITELIMKLANRCAKFSYAWVFVVKCWNDFAMEMILWRYCDCKKKLLRWQKSVTECSFDSCSKCEVLVLRVKKIFKHITIFFHHINFFFSFSVTGKWTKLMNEFLKVYLETRLDPIVPFGRCLISWRYKMSKIMALKLISKLNWLSIPLSVFTI